MQAGTGKTQAAVFKFQYDNTLSVKMLDVKKYGVTFKFQYDNTLRF